MKSISVPFRPSVNVPAFGVMAVSTTEEIQSQARIFDTIKWAGANTITPLMLVNRGTNCTAYEIGMGSFAELPTLAYTTENMAAGTICGPTSNSFAVGANTGGFIVLNATDTASNTVLIQLSPIKTLLGKLDANMAANSTGVAMSIWAGETLADTGKNLSKVLPPPFMEANTSITANTSVMVTLINWRWYVTAATCDT